MSIVLFSHNLTVYQSVCELLKETKKVAVVHPTGTGKSYIAFKLVEDHPDKRFLWLSPSEYIFKTQMANLLREDSQFPIESISFATYAKLMLMDEDSMSAYHPDYIILDEFHRCGAEMWGKSVQTLLKLYPNAQILGLSATAIRYLDNNRNMAEELFEGNVASEMTLGEAIVRGILPAPIYVSTLFQYQNDLEKYQQRIRSMKGKGTQDSNQKYLNALIRAIEKAEGLDVIFRRYMTDNSGKYIVFCSNVEHMQEMQSQVSKWFSKIDLEPHCYAVYSDSAESSKEFTAFKQDNSDHLKLLFCIDMLNEGVHVEGISGVILFRPTVSPIIYKQQIGRALTAGTRRTPLIFDVTNTIEQLCSIDSIQAEMNEAIQIFRENGRSDEIVVEKFQVREQVRDCRKLFRDLENSLNNTWEQYFQAAKEYSLAHNGSLLSMSGKYETENGLCVGRWVNTQRLVRRGLRVGTLTESQIRRLDSIGIVWDNYQELKFQRNYEAAKAYYQKRGDSLVAVDYTTEDEFALGQWIARMRNSYSKGELSQERIDLLNEIGMCWKVSQDNWEKKYQEAVAYYNQHGSIADMPHRYKTESGIALGTWLQNMRIARKNGQEKYGLTEERIQKLNALGMRWESANEIQWTNSYQSAKAYYAQAGTLDNLPWDFKTEDGFPLSDWVRKQKYLLNTANSRQKGHSPERIQLLSEIGIFKTSTARDAQWQEKYDVLRRCCNEMDIKEIASETRIEGVWIGTWLSEQRKAKVAGKLTQERIDALEALGYDWLSVPERKWFNYYYQARAFYRQNDHIKVPQSDTNLYKWVKSQQKSLQNRKLSEEQAELLKGIGIADMERKPLRRIDSSEAPVFNTMASNAN